MLLLAEYFNSPELKAWISSHDDGVDEIELCDFFMELFSLYEPQPGGTRLSSLIQDDWSLFSPSAPVDEILDASAAICGLTVSSASLVRHVENVTVPIDKWMNIKQELRTNRRFFASRLIDEEEDRWNEMLATNKMIEPNQRFFRGRTNMMQDKPFVTEDELSAPSADKATPGRANPYGIPYLYLADSENTMLYELRSVSGDQISIGEFISKNDLQIVSFSYHPDAYSIYIDEDATMLYSLQKSLFLESISKDMSKPIRRYDDENLDYLSTQFVCEYIRLEIKADGIEFPSSRLEGGYNIVVFDKNNFELHRSYQKTVGKIMMEFE